MTEYELAELTASVMSNFLTSFTVFLSIVSGYVITAFAVGEKLTKIQLSIVNVCFLISVGILGFLVVSIYHRFHDLALSIKIAQGTIVAVDFTWPLCALVLAIIFGCFVFMWNARSGNDD